MGYRGRRGRYPGNGPFRDLPPWQRPGRLYGYGRGYGMGYRADPAVCARFPWLPRWWWANPDYEGQIPFPQAPTSEQEKNFLEDQVKYLKQELSEINKRLEELSSKQEGT
jgi:hypothetical protein